MQTDLTPNRVAYKATFKNKVLCRREHVAAALLVHIQNVGSGPGARFPGEVTKETGITREFVTDIEFQVADDRIDNGKASKEFYPRRGREELLLPDRAGLLRAIRRSVDPDRRLRVIYGTYALRCNQAESRTEHHNCDDHEPMTLDRVEVSRPRNSLGVARQIQSRGSFAPTSGSGGIRILGSIC